MAGQSAIANGGHHDDAFRGIIELEQRSLEWHSWRREGVGGSDAKVIMGLGFKSPSELVEEKCQPQVDDEDNEATRRGRLLEPEARRYYIEHIGVDVAECCVQNKRTPWLRASLDGLTADGQRVVEIKCGEGNYDRVCRYGDVPDYDYPQLQHILAVTSLDVVDYWCFHPSGGGVLIPVERNEVFIQHLLPAERQFWEQVTQRRLRVA